MLVIAACVAGALAQPEWEKLEAPILRGQTQLTASADFLKAGEAYFSTSSSASMSVIFQAVRSDSEDAEHYGMYAARFFGMRRESWNPALGRIYQISQPGSANSCGWFHPTDADVVLFGSTVLPPEEHEAAGYQRGTGRYRWAFPSEMEIVSGHVDFAHWKPSEEGARIIERPIVKPLWKEPGYDAEGSWSPDGRFVIYTWVDPETEDPDIYVREPGTGYVKPLVKAAGYDGGPFFSPDGTWITYRSDREGNNLLQLFMAELSFDDDGRPSGIKREIQLTDNEYVNWAPFWHPSGQFLIYASNEAAPEEHDYDVWAIDARGTSAHPKRIRLTYAKGFDGLPVFDASGELMMWTSQRGGSGEGEHGSSQIWVARFDLGAFIEKFEAAETASGE